MILIILTSPWIPHEQLVKSSLGQPLVPGQALNEVGSEVIECHSHSHVPVFSVLFVSSKQHYLCKFLKPLLESPTTCTLPLTRLMRKPNQTCFITLSTPLSCQLERHLSRTKGFESWQKWSITGDMVQVQTCECTMRRRNPPKEDCSLIHGHTTALHFSSVVEV